MSGILSRLTSRLDDGVGPKKPNTLSQAINRSRGSLSSLFGSPSKLQESASMPSSPTKRSPGGLSQNGTPPRSLSRGFSVGRRSSIMGGLPNARLYLASLVHVKKEKSPMEADAIVGTPAPQLHLNLPSTPLLVPFTPLTEDAIEDVFLGTSGRPSRPILNSLSPSRHSSVPTNQVHSRVPSTATIGGNMSEDKGYVAGEESNTEEPSHDGFEHVNMSRTKIYPPPGRSRSTLVTEKRLHKWEGDAPGGYVNEPLISRPTCPDSLSGRLATTHSSDESEMDDHSDRQTSIPRITNLKRGLCELDMKRSGKGGAKGATAKPDVEPHRIPSAAYEADSEAEDSELSTLTSL